MDVLRSCLLTKALSCIIKYKVKFVNKNYEQYAIMLWSDWISNKSNEYDWKLILIDIPMIAYETKKALDQVSFVVEQQFNKEYIKTLAF